jgi:hypothetical protein
MLYIKEVLENGFEQKQRLFYKDTDRYRFIVEDTDTKKLYDFKDCKDKSVYGDLVNFGHIFRTSWVEAEALKYIDNVEYFQTHTIIQELRDKFPKHKVDVLHDIDTNPHTVLFNGDNCFQFFEGLTCIQSGSVLVLGDVRISIYNLLDMLYKHYPNTLKLDTLYLYSDSRGYEKVAIKLLPNFKRFYTKYHILNE